MKYIFYGLLVLGLLGARLASTSTTEGPRAPANDESPVSPPESSQSKQKEDELPAFIPSEKVPAESAVSFPVDI